MNQKTKQNKNHYKIKLKIRKRIRKQKNLQALRGEQVCQIQN